MNMNTKIDSDTTAGLPTGYSVVGKDADIMVAANRSNPAAGLFYARVRDIEPDGAPVWSSTPLQTADVEWGSELEAVSAWLDMLTP